MEHHEMSNGPEAKSDRHFDLLDSVEQDIRNLMCQLAEAKCSIAEKEKKEAEVKKGFFLSIIEVMDGFERLFLRIHDKQDQVTPQMKKWIGNFRTIYRLLNKIIKDEGVVRIENLDDGFDPHWHKIEETVVDPSKLDGTIVDEVLHGYVWQNVPLRKSLVVVVRNSGEREPEGEESRDESTKVEE